MSRSDPSSFTHRLRKPASVRVRALGVRNPVWQDLYHRLMVLSWPRLAGLFIACFLVFNLAFAALYRLDPQGLSQPHDPAAAPLFWRDFFFSVHTVATIGYGNIYPVSLYANALVVTEITLGILFFALVTGIAFARFSRPTARILFSEVAVVREVDGVPTLMLRAANQRMNLIFSAKARLSLLEDCMVGGTWMRRFRDLPLERASNPMFALTWTMIHRIDAASPLRPWVDDPAHAAPLELVVVLSGFDESSGQTIHGRYAYGRDDLRHGARFVDILGKDETGARTIDYARFHAVEHEGPSSGGGAHLPLDRAPDNAGERR